ncbi:EF-P lysine aminoacylase EpmA [Thermodesulfobacteriota bacterium]
MSPESRNNSIPKGTKILYERKNHLHIRSRMTQIIRAFFIERGFLEVETPQIVNETPPEVHIDPIPVGDKLLNTSPELCMKRLLSAGYKKIFQITKCFRNGERGSLHLPEFTLLEWYHAGIDYSALMDESEALFSSVANGLESGGEISYQGRIIDFMAQWKRITIDEAFDRYASLDIAEALRKDIFNRIMVEEIEPNLGLDGPVFIYDFPKALAALSRLKPENNEYAERFEIYIAGIELANGFSELNDPLEQEERFTYEQWQRKKRGKKVYPLPKKFLTSLEHMPEASGIAVGLDRLAMIFADRSKIDDVVAFTPEEL